MEEQKDNLELTESSLDNQEGNIQEILELIKLCKMGPGSAKIDYVQINNYNKDYIKKDFDIIKSD